MKKNFKLKKSQIKKLLTTKKSTVNCFSGGCTLNNQKNKSNITFEELKMSGGYFNYKQYEFDNIADNIEQVIKDWEDKKKSRWSDDPKWDFKDPSTILELHNAVNIIRTAKIYAQRVDWLLSDDDGEKEFHQRLKEDIKNMTQHSKNSQVVSTRRNENG